MESIKPPFILLLNIVIYLFSINALNVHADEKSNQVAYTQASTSNLRAERSSDAEIVQKLPINTEVNVLDKKTDWLFIKLSDEKELKGWLHQSLIAEKPLTLSVALNRFRSLPNSDRAKLSWIERAAAIAPNTPYVLDELIKTLRQFNENDRAEQVRMTSSKYFPHYSSSQYDGVWNFLYPTTTHAGESPLNPGTGWFALREGYGGWELVETAIKVKIEESEITEFDVNISSEQSNTLAMFKNALLVPGPVDAITLPKGVEDKYFGGYENDNPKFTTNIEFKGESYQLIYDQKEAVGVDYKGREYTYKENALILRSGNNESFLGRYPDRYFSGDDDLVQVIWVGDIDRDNKLDVITSYQEHNAGGYCVQLSSGAEPGKLFSSHDCHYGSGC